MWDKFHTLKILKNHQLMKFLAEIITGVFAQSDV